MKSLIIFSLFFIYYIHTQDTENNDPILIYGLDNIKINENSISLNLLTNSKKLEKLNIKQSDTVYECPCKEAENPFCDCTEEENPSCDCTPEKNLPKFYNISCSKDNLKVKERLFIDEEKNEDILFTSYSSAQSKYLQRAEENKIKFEKLKNGIVDLSECKNVTGTNPMILINCKSDKPKNESSIFYIGDGITKIPIPSKMTMTKEKGRIQIELSPPISFYNVSFNNIIGVSKEKNRIYLMHFEKGEKDEFNFTYISKNAPKKKGSKLSAGAILAIIIPSVLAIAAVIAIIILLAGKSGAPVATSAPNPQTYNTLGLNSSSSVNKN